MSVEIIEVATFKKDLSDDERLQFDMQYMAGRKEPSTAILLSLFLGVFGVDRFYNKQVALGILKLMTFGGLFFWAFIDWFLIMGATRKRNILTAGQIRESIVLLRRPAIAAA